MREKIDTLEIAERFNKPHRYVLRSVRNLTESGDLLVLSYFMAREYTNRQNKKQPMFEMGLNGFCLMTDTWGYSRGESALVKAQILSEFGESFAVVGSLRSRPEDCFYEMLKEFLHLDKVVRQFPVSLWWVDFYLPDYGLIIEYDEDQHFSARARKQDEEREKGVREFFRSEFDDIVSIVRVKRGEEIKGLSKIAGQIALITNNATGITKYAE